KSGFATATEISAFAVLYALIVGGVVFRELGWRATAQSFVQAATRSGLVLFIVSAAQALAFVLTLQQVPHAVADMLVRLSGTHGTWLFLLLSIAILIVMGSVLEGAAARNIFGRLPMPVGVRLPVAPRADAGCDAAPCRPAAFRRGAGVRHGDRPVRAAARPRPLRRLPDRQG